MGACESSPSPSDFFVVHNGEKAMSKVATDKVQTLIMFKEMFRHGGDTYKIKRKEDENEVLQVEGKVSKGKSDRMVLRDMSGKPVAVLIGPRGNWKPTFYIYGVEPKLSGQEPSGEEQDEQGVKLYSWAYAVAGSGIRTTYHLYLATGKNQYEELGYTASLAIDTKICIEKQGKGGACLAERANELMFKDSYEVTVAAGIDPALMITFVAAIKEIQEMNT